MFEGKYSRALTIGLIALIVLVIGIITFFTVSYIRNSNERAQALEAADEFEGTVNRVKTKTNTEDGDLISINVQAENLTMSDSNSDSSTPMYKGFPMAGTISIPKIDLNIPVLADASKKAIDVSVAVNGGPGLNKVGNTIIIGHNYRDGRFFANIKNLSNGDKIYITDNSGNKVEYNVYNIYTTTPEDSDFMDRETEGRREITLDTCTDDTQSRLIIWASAD